MRDGSRSVRTAVLAIAFGAASVMAEPATTPSPVPTTGRAGPVVAAPRVAIEPAPFTATYRMLRNSIIIAEARFQLARDGEDGWTFTSETKPAGLVALLRHDLIVEHSAFRLGGDLRPIPLHYTYEHKGSDKDRDGRYAFDWQGQRVTGTFRGKPIDLPLARGTLDPLTLRLTVGLDLARGTLLDAYDVVERRQVHRYRLERLAPQRIRVPAGEVDVVGVVRRSEDGTKTTRFLYAPANNWTPAFMEQAETDGATYRLELLSFERG